MLIRFPMAQRRAAIRVGGNHRSLMTAAALLQHAFGLAQAPNAAGLLTLADRMVATAHGNHLSFIHPDEPDGTWLAFDVPIAHIRNARSALQPVLLHENVNALQVVRLVG